MRSRKKEGVYFMSILKRQVLFVLFAFAATLCAFAQNKTITGLVVDGNGESIIGASVQIKGAATGVITNIDGKFTIMATPSDVILISYVGYTPKEIKIGSRKVLSIDLNEDAKQLEEVVITAYGTGQKKASMVGSVESIKPA